MSEKTKKRLQKKKTKEQLWLEALNSEDTQKINSAIKEIRNNASLNFFPDLIKFYYQNKNTPTGKKIYSVLCDIKEKDMIPLVFDYINNQNYRKIKKDLVAICWQTRLDYSQYLETLTNIFLYDEFETAFEAYTAIEYMEEINDKQAAYNSIKLLKENFKEAGEQKMTLLLDLVRLIKNKAGIKDD